MKDFKARIKQRFLKVSYIFESILAILILIQVLFGTIDLFRILWDAYILDIANPVSHQQFEVFLGQALLLVIGVELVIMLTLHTPGSIIEALLYAIARKLLLIPKDKGMIEVILGIAAIGGLFAIKRYLIDDEKKDKQGNINKD